MSPSTNTQTVNDSTLNTDMIACIWDLNLLQQLRLKIRIKCLSARQTYSIIEAYTCDMNMLSLLVPAELNQFDREDASLLVQ